MTQALDDEEIRAWLERLAPGLAELLGRLHENESWTVDHQGSGFGRALRELAHVLGAQASAEVLIPEPLLEDFARCMAYASFGRSARIMSLAGRRQPGLGGDLLVYCARQQEPGASREAEAKVLMSRIAALVRLGSFLRVFGPDRRDDVLAILQAVEGQ